MKTQDAEKIAKNKLVKIANKNYPESFYFFWDKEDKKFVCIDGTYRKDSLHCYCNREHENDWYVINDTPNKLYKYNIIAERHNRYKHIVKIEKDKDRYKVGTSIFLQIIYNEFLEPFAKVSRENLFRIIYVSCEEIEVKP